MDLDISVEDVVFREEVRSFFASEYPADILAKMRRGQLLDRDDHVRSQQALHARGWLGITWPAKYGGTGWSAMQRMIFDEEIERAGAPNLIPMALLYIGPIICAFGSAEQKARWLPDILNSKNLWAQGYSEPEAGSDLAGLRFTARREGNDYTLDGVKIWTSGAHWADWIFCLARTSREARRQDGISLICAPMDLPGISVHPIISIDGTHELNRVVFDNVKVPIANRIGEEGRAWHYANVLLKNERLSYAHIGRKRMDLDLLQARSALIAAEQRWTPGRIDAFNRVLAACRAEVDILEISVLRALIDDANAATVAGLKILCTEMAQRVTELQMELAGRLAAPALDRRASNSGRVAPLVPEWQMLAAPTYLFERAQTIYGGATEVQKMIAWRAVNR